MTYSSGCASWKLTRTFSLRSFFRLRDHHFALAQITTASAVARSICASLAAAPCRAADGRRIFRSRKAVLEIVAQHGFFFGAICRFWSASGGADDDFHGSLFARVKSIEPIGSFLERGMSCNQRLDSNSTRSE